MISLQTIWDYITGQVTAQLAILIDHTNQTLAVFLQFAQVTQGEIEYIAHIFGYAGAPNPITPIQTDLTTVLANQATILAAINTRQETGQAVTLPAAAPTGYGGADAAGVWGYVEAGSARSQGYWQVQAGGYAHNASAGTYRRVPTWAATEGWSLAGDFYNDAEADPTPSTVSPVPLGSILVTDATYLDWVTRVNGAAPSGVLNGRAYVFEPTGGWTWVLDTSEGDFQIYQATVLGVGAHHTPTAPVWPGLAKATLGGITALSTGLTVTTPMDGVIISLTSVPTLRGHYDYDGLAGWLNIGALTFLDDNGEAEFYQSLSFTQQVYTPKSMARAASVKIRTAPGVVGTVQPWVVT